MLAPTAMPLVVVTMLLVLLVVDLEVGRMVLLQALAVLLGVGLKPLLLHPVASTSGGRLSLYCRKHSRYIRMLVGRCAGLHVRA